MGRSIYRQTVKTVDIIALSGGSITVNGTGTAYSKSFQLPSDASFAFEVKFSSVGTINVKIELEQSNRKPAVESAADADWVIPVGKAASPIFSAVTVATPKIDSYAPVATVWARLKLTGLSGNDAATALDRAIMSYVEDRP